MFRLKERFSKAMGPLFRAQLFARHLSAGSKSANRIVYTETDEAPQLATYSLLPIIQRFVGSVGVNVELGDISLASRIITQFNDRLAKEQQKEDVLAELGELTHDPNANIIKLPNISASVPQLNEAIAELQAKGYDLPNYVQDPNTPEEIEVAKRYAKAMGSVVNPVLREGNSDRRVAKPVKKHAQKNPHRMMKPYEPTCKAHVAHMDGHDFYGSELSYVMPEAGTVQIEFVSATGEVTVLKKPFAMEKGEVIDASMMSVDALREFYEAEITRAKEEGMLLSLHLKATMMKVSDPIMFGHCVTVYYKQVFDKYKEVFETLGVNPNNGVGDVYDKIASLPAKEREAIESDIQAVYESRPALAMVDSYKGITNLHVPSDVIIDASMPNVARDGGKMWGADDKLHEVTCMIPDRCYAGIYDEVLKFCKANGAFDPSTMGTVNNVGLMAQKAEEYGSHNKTFEMTADGKVRVVDNNGKQIFQHEVKAGDIWRMCQTKDSSIKDWVKLAVNRAKATKYPTIFWLDDVRAHDRSIREKVNAYLPQFDTNGLDISIETPENAMKISLQRAKDGLNTISVTGNVLRDYLTDLFPILELGTSAKMLSIVPMLAGGGMYETGAGGSAPKVTLLS